MFEDGFFKSGRQLESSVIKYAEDMGILRPRLGGPSRSNPPACNPGTCNNPRHGHNPKGQRQELERLARQCGLYVSTWSPGDGQTRYRFTTEPVDYFAAVSRNTLTTVRGFKKALDFVQAYCAGRGRTNPLTSRESAQALRRARGVRAGAAAYRGIGLSSAAFEAGRAAGMTEIIQSHGGRRAQRTAREIQLQAYKEYEKWMSGVQTNPKTSLAARDFISSKISKIMREGIRGRRVSQAQAQAIAVAFSMARAAGFKVPAAPNPALYYHDLTRGQHVGALAKSVEALSPRPFKVVLTSPRGKQIKPRLARGVYMKDLDNPMYRVFMRTPRGAGAFRVKAATEKKAIQRARASLRKSGVSRASVMGVRAEPNPLLLTLTGNPRRNPPTFRDGQKIPIAQARAWARAHGLSSEFEKAVKLQTKANRPPTHFMFKRIPFGQAKSTHRAVLVHYGDSPETRYVPPKGSKKLDGKGPITYRHKWGEGSGKHKPVPVLADPSGKMIIKVMGKGQHTGDWMRG